MILLKITLICSPIKTTAVREYKQCPCQQDNSAGNMFGFSLVSARYNINGMNTIVLFEKMWTFQEYKPSDVASEIFMKT